MKIITVCDRCLQASCWQGEFMCDESQTAGTTEKSIAELQKLNLEHECWWNIDPIYGVAKHLVTRMEKK